MIASSQEVSMDEWDRIPPSKDHLSRVAGVLRSCILRICHILGVVGHLDKFASFVKTFLHFPWEMTSGGNSQSNFRENGLY